MQKVQPFFYLDSLAFHYSWLAFIHLIILFNYLGINVSCNSISNANVFNSSG
ncbi:hypothetical protein LR48_Vigan2329s000100 [Vigna angularis]|nr:hypothetical protein LR48_Vigan2329s000100 [Vigna angularis]